MAKEKWERWWHEGRDYKYEIAHNGSIVVLATVDESLDCPCYGTAMVVRTNGENSGTYDTALDCGELDCGEYVLSNGDLNFLRDIEGDVREFEDSCMRKE
jgi:hypothetical protein|tara:strand:+ start:122 stop:421 length:300 start_codon:yes stop_codon:yes gene_type:complete